MFFQQIWFSHFKNRALLEPSARRRLETLRFCFLLRRTNQCRRSNHHLRKSAGNKTTEVDKNLNSSTIFSPFLVELVLEFNGGIFPDSHRIEKAIPVFKSVDHSNSNKHQPSPISIVSKNFDSAVPYRSYDYQQFCRPKIRRQKFHRRKFCRNTARVKSMVN